MMKIEVLSQLIESKIQWNDNKIGSKECFVVNLGGLFIKINDEVILLNENCHSIG